MQVDTLFPRLHTKAIPWLSFPRTELLECLGDTDFLAKLHCVRQACQVYHAHWALLWHQTMKPSEPVSWCVFFHPQLILSDRTTRTFLVDTGKKILSSIIVKAQKVGHELTKASGYALESWIHWHYVVSKWPRYFIGLSEPKEIWGSVWGDDFLLGAHRALGEHRSRAGHSWGKSLFLQKYSIELHKNCSIINSFVLISSPDQALEFLWHSPGLYPHGLLWGPWKPSRVHSECGQQPLAEQLLQRDSESPVLPPSMALHRV